MFDASLLTMLKAMRNLFLFSLVGNDYIYLYILIVIPVASVNCRMPYMIELAGSGIGGMLSSLHGFNTGVGTYTFS